MLFIISLKSYYYCLSRPGYLRTEMLCCCLCGSASVYRSYAPVLQGTKFKYCGCGYYKWFSVKKKWNVLHYRNQVKYSLRYVFTAMWSLGLWSKYDVVDHHSRLAARILANLCKSWDYASYDVTLLFTADITLLLYCM